MGSGKFTASAFAAYSTATKCAATLSDGMLDLRGMSVQDVYKSRDLDPALRITGKTVRECRDSDEHPATVPVILALDVTGSMGPAAMEVASALGKVMTELYKSVKDVEFMVMAIGDFAYDDAPVQVSQFESDVRIAEHLDKVFFEGGGGGNDYESYTAAWFVGARHTDLDCWKRGKKGLIITIGDEPLNPYISAYDMRTKIDDIELQGDVETKALRKEVADKYEVAHIHVTHGHGSNARQGEVERTCRMYDVPLTVCTVNAISDVIIKLVQEHAGSDNVATEIAIPVDTPPAQEGDITW